MKCTTIAAMIMIALSLQAGCGGGGGSSADTTKPTFTSAVITGNTVVLTYGEALDAVNIPAASAFTVRVNGTPANLAGTNAISVNSANKTVTVMLAAAVYSTDTVTVAYADPTAGNDVNAIQDSSGNDVASLAGQAVTNGAARIAKGFWSGTTGTVYTSAIVLANGDAWLVFQESNVITRFARLKVAASGTSFSSTGSQYLLQSGTTETAAATGTFSEKSTLSAVMSAASGTTTLTNLLFNTRYETAALQDDAVGSWTGSFGGNSSSRTMVVASTGALTGTSTTGCSYSGTMLPRNTDPALFDVNVTETCVVGSPTVLSGIATVNAAKTALSMAVTTADKASGALFMGIKL